MPIIGPGDVAKRTWGGLLPAGRDCASAGLPDMKSQPELRAPAGQSTSKRVFKNHVKLDISVKALRKILEHFGTFLNVCFG